MITIDPKAKNYSILKEMLDSGMRIRQIRNLVVSVRKWNLSYLAVFNNGWSDPRNNDPDAEKKAFEKLTKNVAKEWKIDLNRDPKAVSKLAWISKEEIDALEVENITMETK